MTTPTEQNVKTTNVKDVLAYLADKFPACFSLTGEAKPLKIGIFQDLAERLQTDESVSKTQLRQALRVYTSSWRYLEATKEGIARVDLDGVDGDLIDASQAEHASKTLEQSKAKAAEKRKARIAEAKAKQVNTVADKPAYKKNQNKKPNQASKEAKVNQKPARAEPVVSKPVTLQPVVMSAVVAGAKVLIKLGQNPMPATVLEVNKDDVTVQLGSGMVIKTRQDSLYLA
ncbi:MAG: RNA chaperone ProQ [Gammaproteobacteria bacterium]|nr:RNA chaperone ProQ [Gammaproteobacteria bacterium]MBU1556584.1 RNA chaperone ProQ [Gammaproteobacteria bacterium]MBU2072624.1 RNA chaperone ProQ [Gammaproteobacteria bacterium]MBU2182242.1 RNA chaperone ProQ [Gammaproteobacteria bacterium]MBU2204754.1 RNA chaperone ProQ [Gammaproteobacteria bacterium]